MIRRCAIYTRKSTDEGLDQAFNSLDAQREACEAYIASQRGEGWRAIKTRYDDGGLSGGNMERPALKALLQDIDEDKVDIIVVYKVDRLTRSLADFAKLVERFDKHEVSFVSVTQQFNTSNSMGRLTLNVLLSFAQFEREVGAERVRDKIAASRKKGLWTGGNPPHGYDNVDKKLIINEQEAKTVKRLYELYLENRCVRDVLEIARREGLMTKRRSDGSGGKPLTRGPLYYILANPIYAGFVRSGQKLYEGEHQPMIDQKTWKKVQEKRLQASQRAGKKSSRTNPLTGKLYAEGERLTPSHTTKDGRRYRYYITGNDAPGRTPSAERWRIRADALEDTILRTIDAWLTSSIAASMMLQKGAPARKIQLLNEHLATLSQTEQPLSPQARIETWADRIERVDIEEGNISIIIRPELICSDNSKFNFEGKCTIHSEININRSALGLRLVLGKTESEKAPSSTLRRLLLRAHDWRDRWFAHLGTSISELAKEAKTHPANISREIRLAFLAPDIVKALLDGTVSASLNTERLKHLDALPPEWSEQRRMFGLPDAGNISPRH